MVRLHQFIAASLIAVTASAGQSQTVRATTGPTIQRIVPATIAAAANQARKPAALPKPAIAVAAQKAMSLPTQPTVADPQVLDAAHLVAGETSMWLENVIYGSNGTPGSSPFVALGATGAPPRLNINYRSIGKATMVDCSFLEAFSETPSLMVSYTARKTVGSSGTPLFTGSSSLSNGHAVIALPPAPVPNGTLISVQIDYAKALPTPTDYMILDSCKVYQVG